MLTIKLAWRNLFRNRRRTFIAGIATGIGLAAMMFSDALMIGMKNHLVQAATASYLGEGQLHADDYRRVRETTLTISDFSRVYQELREDSRVKNVTPRILARGMIASPANVQSVQLLGARPDSERRLSLIDDAIIEGGFLERPVGRELVVGAKLADLLEAGVGERIVITVTEAHSGRLVQELFRISGIYRMGTPELDRGMAVMPIDTARDMLAFSRDEAHELALTLVNPELARRPDAPFWKRYSSGVNEALPWPALMPQLEAMFQYSDLGLTIVAVILFGVVALGIVNTLFMSIYERTFEFGVLRAIGTRPGALWSLIVCEAAVLAVLSGLVGICLGTVTIWLVSLTGIDYSGVEMMGVTMQQPIFPVFNVDQFVVYPFWLLVFTTLVGFYPASHAARIVPAEALHRSL